MGAEPINWQFLHVEIAGETSGVDVGRRGENARKDAQAQSGQLSLARRCERRQGDAVEETEEFVDEDESVSEAKHW